MVPNFELISSEMEGVELIYFRKDFNNKKTNIGGGIST